MSKRWTFADDCFLHAYFPAIGDFIGVHDLGRPKGAAARRVAHLTKTGAWAALDAMGVASADYARCLGLDYADVEEQVIADLREQEAP